MDLVTAGVEMWTSPDLSSAFSYTGLIQGWRAYSVMIELHHDRSMDVYSMPIYIWENGLMNDFITGYFESPTCEACISGCVGKFNGAMSCPPK